MRTLTLVLLVALLLSWWSGQAASALSWAVSQVRETWPSAWPGGGFAPLSFAGVGAWLEGFARPLALLGIAGSAFLPLALLLGYVLAAQLAVSLAVASLRRAAGGGRP